MIIRMEGANDWNRTRAIHDLAFGRTEEGALVRELLDTHGAGRHLSFVAEEESGVVGHILLSRVTIGEENTLEGMLIGPHGVLPSYQGRGIGRALLEAAMAFAEREGDGIFLVVGPCAYYGRFGFEPADCYGVVCPEPSQTGTLLVRVADRSLCSVLKGPMRTSGERQKEVLSQYYR